MVRFSGDGVSWSTAKKFGDTDWWVWRLNWHNKKAYGIGYYYPSNRVQLYHGDPRRTFELLDDNIFGLDKNGKGYPNESDILFMDDGTALCVLRRDADTCTAQIGVANAPYKDWSWTDVGYYVGAPKLIKVKGKIILAGRSWNKDEGCKTSIWLVNSARLTLDRLFTLPSQGDTSYPGMVVSKDRLLLSYYSQHQENKCKIFLANIKIN
ncbi:hypothetical protein [Thalassotalea atypica]|uniref:hypothetical protein n=1 Tax=Thalassotalea atypica TaxID=2054316 RepID=UPI002572A88F|nr:hypothetical protein [Thalassotalea atypica]